MKTKKCKCEEKKKKPCKKIDYADAMYLAQNEPNKILLHIIAEKVFSMSFILESDIASDKSYDEIAAMVKYYAIDVLQLLMLHNNRQFLSSIIHAFYESQIKQEGKTLSEGKTVSL